MRFVKWALTAIVITALAQFASASSVLTTGAGFPQSAAVIATYISNGQSTAGTTSNTFTSQAIGTAAADRVVVVGYFIRNVGAADCAGATIGGVSATFITKANNNLDGNSVLICFYALNVTTGTTATIVISATASILRSGLGVWNINGTGGVVTQFATASDVSKTAGAPSVTLSTHSGGAAIGMSGNGSFVASLAWVGLTQDFNLGIVGNANTFSGAHTNSTSSPTTSISQTGTGFSNPALVTVSW